MNFCWTKRVKKSSQTHRCRIHIVLFIEVKMIKMCQTHKHINIYGVCVCTIFFAVAVTISPYSVKFELKKNWISLKFIDWMFQFFKHSFYHLKIEFEPKYTILYRLLSGTSLWQTVDAKSNYNVYRLEMDRQNNFFCINYE